MARWEQAPLVTEAVTGSSAPQGGGRARWMDAPLVDENEGKPLLERSWLGRRAQDVADFAVETYDAAFPERDPATADLPGFTGEGITSAEDRSAIERAKLTSAGFEDEPWREAVLGALGDRVTGLRQDKFGHEIVEYRGDDGESYSAYINRPGLDWQDVDRAATGALPYMVGAGAAQKGMAAAGIGKTLLSRAPVQGLTAGAVSIGQDVAADQPLGSDQLVKAGLTALFGAGGEIAGTAFGRLLQRWQGAGLVDDAGNLTDAGRREAERLKLDPDQVQGEVAKRLGELRRTTDPHAAAAGIEAGEFGIPTTAGQRAKDPAQLNVEEQMRRSLFGQGARDVITEFDAAQREAIANAGKKVREELAPRASETIPETGQAIGEGLRAAQRTADDQIGQAWDNVTPLRPVMSQGKTGDAARGLLTQHLRQELDGLGFFPDEHLTPTAHHMMKSLTSYARGAPEDVPYEILGKPDKGLLPLDTMRRRLFKQYESAAPGQDRAAARAIYNAFNNWTQDATGQQLVRNQAGRFASKAAAKPIEAARTITREKRALFAPKDTRGKLTPAGKILTDLAENADTPERIVQTLFGTSVGSTPKAGTAGAVHRLRTVLKKDDPVAWDQTKAAYFLKMITGTDGEMLSPQRLGKSIDQAFANQPAVVGLLFDKEEKAFIRRFQNAVKAAAYKPPNPSGTSYALEDIRRKKDNAIGYVLKRLGTRATFQGKIWQGTMYHWLARTLPNIFNVQDAASRSLARKAIGQTLDFTPDTGELMAGLSAAWEAERAGGE